jgi:hypothetical protein
MAHTTNTDDAEREECKAIIEAHVRPMKTQMMTKARSMYPRCVSVINVSENNTKMTGKYCTANELHELVEVVDEQLIADLTREQAQYNPAKDLLVLICIADRVEARSYIFIV